MRLRFANIVAIISLLLTGTTSYAQNLFGLLDAGPQNFAVLNLGGNFQFNSDNTSQFQTITGLGNVGLMSGSSSSISGGSNTTSTGALYLGPGLSDPATGHAVFSGGVITSGTLASELSASGIIYNDAINAANNLRSLTADQKLSTTPATITATHSGQNVIQLSGDINNSLTLNPGSFSNVTFVVNVLGKIQLSGGNGLLTTGGLLDQNVIYNVTGNVATSGGGTGQTSHGIILAPQSSIAWDAVQLNGQLIGQSVAVVSGGRVNNTYHSAAQTPEPGSTALMIGLTITGAVMVRKRRKRSAAA
jgi:hypothetical protein